MMWARSDWLALIRTFDKFVAKLGCLVFNKKDYRDSPVKLRARTCWKCMHWRFRQSWYEVILHTRSYHVLLHSPTVHVCIWHVILSPDYSVCCIASDVYPDQEFSPHEGNSVRIADTVCELHFQPHLRALRMTIPPWAKEIYPKTINLTSASLSFLVIAGHFSYQLKMSHSDSPGRRLQIHETSLSFVKVVARCSWARRSGRPCSFRSPIMDMMQYSYFASHVIVLQFLAVDRLFYTMKGMSHAVMTPCTCAYSNDQKGPKGTKSDQKGPKGTKRDQKESKKRRKRDHKGSKLQFQCLRSFVCIVDQSWENICICQLCILDTDIHRWTLRDRKWEGFAVCISREAYMQVCAGCVQRILWSVQELPGDWQCKQGKDHAEIRGRILR